MYRNACILCEKWVFFHLVCIKVHPLPVLRFKSGNRGYHKCQLTSAKKRSISSYRNSLVDLWMKKKKAIRNLYTVCMYTFFNSVSRMGYLTVLGEWFRRLTFGYLTLWYDMWCRPYTVQGLRLKRTAYLHTNF